MSNSNLTPKQRKAKKLIGQALFNAQKDLESAKNELEQVQVLNKLEDLVQAEIYAWTNMCTEDKNRSAAEQNALLDEAAKHIADFESIIDKINDARKDLLPKALKLQETMIKSRILPAPLIKNK